jgi:hypothetical protein
MDYKFVQQESTLYKLACNSFHTYSGIPAAVFACFRKKKLIHYLIYTMFFFFLTEGQRFVKTQEMLTVRGWVT